MVNNLCDFRQVGHFYFCLLVSIKIEMKINKDVSQDEMKMFISRWLGNAKDRRIFGHLLLNDILWLEDELAQQSFYQFYSQISRINNIISESPHLHINAIYSVKSSDVSNVHYL